MNSVINFLFKRYDPRKVVAIMGNNDISVKLGKFFLNQKNLNFAGFLNEAACLNTFGNNNISEQIKAAAEWGVEEVYLSDHPENIKNLTLLIQEAEINCIRLKMAPALYSHQTEFNVESIREFTSVSARNEPLETASNYFQKRVLDVLISLFVIVFVFSWLYPILAIIIKLQSPGPVIFAQLRTGKNNKPFWCYKFRSMKLNDESDIRQASLSDERITPIGKFMRRTSLDEFPQFFNVLMGYMSIVGPRPHMTMHTNEYKQVIDNYMLRQLLKPGITGWAQINGYRGETKQVELMRQRVKHDIWYSENWTLWLDIKIIACTFFDMFRNNTNAC